MTTLYSPAVIALSKDTSHTGRLEAPTATASLDNPLCGDRVTVDLRVEGGVVSALRHRTRGCALCKASAALLCESLEGASVTVARSTAVAASAALEGGSDDPLPAPLDPFGPVRHTPARTMCVTLPWICFASALNS